MAEPAKDKLVPRRKSRIGRLLVFVGVIVILGFAGFFIWRYLNTYETTDDAQIDGHIEMCIRDRR